MTSAAPLPPLGAGEVAVDAGPVERAAHAVESSSRQMTLNFFTLTS